MGASGQAITTARRDFLMLAAAHLWCIDAILLLEPGQVLVNGGRALQAGVLELGVCGVAGCMAQAARRMLGGRQLCGLLWRFCESRWVLGAVRSG